MRLSEWSCRPYGPQAPDTWAERSLASYQVVAEGVETVGQLQALGRAGCQMAQGYYFSRPLPADECRELLLEVEDRSSFTDTLCMKLAGSPR
jgi:predicted signal transduction protein with EAL and GGDEF domain